MFLMSYVTVFLVKHGKTYHFSLHYRAVQRLLERNFDTVQASPLDNTAIPLDAGYLVVDLDRKEVINRQEAFSSKHVKGSDLLWDSV